MRLRTHILLVGLLTGVLIEGAQAGEAPRGDCPPPPPGPEFTPGGPGGPPGFGRHGPGPGRNFLVRVLPLAEFDLDKDGRVSREEIDRGLKARFKEADADDDGSLDPEEFADAQPAPPGPPPFRGRPETMPLPPPPPGAGCPCDCDERGEGKGPGRRGEWHMRHRPDPRAAFNHLDWNLDGELSFEEYAAPIRQMALHLDRNGDGVIDADEMKGPGMFFGPGSGPPPGHPPPRDR